MGLFSRKKAAAAPKRDDAIARSVITPAVSVMIADGNVDESELAQLSNLCGFSPIFMHYDSKTLTEMVKSIIETIQAKGHQGALSEASGHLSPPLRETALTFAMRLAFADGRIEDGEKNALAATAGIMEIPQDMFSKILEVVAIMQRPVTAEA